VKEASGDLAQIATVVALCPDDFIVVSGDDALTLPLLAVGGRGVISTSANVAPAEMVDLVRAFRAGDRERALRTHQRLLPLFDALFCETNPIPVKAALGLMGLVGDEIRLPLTRLTDANRERLQVVLKEIGLV
jgi:4-hydroxy-tetrahydrodipicolinate synthase